MFIPYVFKTYDIKKLSAQVYSTNIVSSRILYDLGFKYEGTLEKHTVVNNNPVDILFFSIVS